MRGGVFVASAKPFTPSHATKPGDRAPAEAVFNGTLGDVYMELPKLDTYCPPDAQKRAESLEWTKRGEGEEELSCRCAQLYMFDSLETDKPVLSTDHAVIRRVDELSSAWIEYVPLSDLGSVPPDSSVSSSHLSSIQTLSGWLQLYSFNKDRPERNEISVDIGEESRQLLPEGYDFVVRKTATNGDRVLEYMSLSASISALSALSGGGAGCSCDVSCDLSAGTKVASWTKDGWETHKDIYVPVYPAPFDFDQKEKKIVNCVWYMGRTVRQLQDYAVDELSSCTYWLKIETDQNGQYSQCSIIKNTYAVPFNGGAFAAPENTDRNTHWPLWSISAGESGLTPTFDWRGAWKTPFYST